MADTLILTLWHTEAPAPRDLELPDNVHWEILAPIVLDKLGWPALSDELSVVEHTLESEDVVVRPGLTLAAAGALTGMSFQLRSRVLPERRRPNANISGPHLRNALGEVFALTTGLNWIGRGEPGCVHTIAIDLARHDRDGSVSRRHARLLVADSGASVEDADSVNGTWVNGRRLRPGVAQALRPRDRLQFGDVSLRFEHPTSA
ncbi:MAG: FHA domain-containing protein [Anaerolineales bacterium]|nr:FHA domain-containing protein [Anaerolineales bacterium]